MIANWEKREGNSRGATFVMGRTNPNASRRKTAMSIADDSGYLRRGIAYMAVGGGHAIEYYDWMLYGLLAAFFAPQFFPAGNPVTSTLNALAVFSAAFAARPLGAAMLGPLADRLGRKPMMLISVAAMSLCSFAIGSLPTFKSAGWNAAAALTALRLLQGLSNGVEIPLMSSYVVELAPEGRFGWYAGLMQVASNAGILLASFASFAITLILGNDGTASWGWRVPFWFGGILGLGVFWLRRNLPETLPKSERFSGRRTLVVWQDVRRHALALAATTFMIGGTLIMTYCWLSGLPTAAKAIFGQSGTVVFGMTTLLSTLVLLLCPLIGHIADHFGLGRMFVWTRLISIPLLFTTMLYDQRSVIAFVIVMLVGAILLPLALAFVNALVASLMPMEARVTGVGLGFALGVSLFGGSAPYLFVWFSSMGVFWVFPTYVGMVLLISVLLYVAAVRATGMYLDVDARERPEADDQRAILSLSTLESRT
jgi:MFS transporter, MHS family, alpha-ketoglutarate permease